ncbi:hypothetical protein K431DRAFT_323289 [Polychaeton citri CBS 116435]|uniref:Uncharacterized protein n=1 Tax=Polychaeton citri CBS 116435 TaxID=1314669 RepID=A0A9P4UKB1_9PEZI|nr:hypothetical protein K431DRAFT_323289 [Polychaeton citri CBS 116435]
MTSPKTAQHISVKPLGSKNWDVEGVPSANHEGYGRIDAGVARCTNGVGINISTEKNGRLEKLIDRGVLPRTILTYFLQALEGSGQGTPCISPASHVGARHAACNNFASLVAVRTFLGIFDAGCGEQMQAVTYWYLMETQQIVAGLLAYCFSLFLQTVRPRDKYLMIERVRSNQTGSRNKKFWLGVAGVETLHDPQTQCYSLIQLHTTLPALGLGALANIIITHAGLGFTVPSFVGTIVLAIVPNTSKATEAGCPPTALLWFWPSQTLGVSVRSRHSAGQTKKSVCVALDLVSQAAGNTIESQVVVTWDAPRYFIALSVHLACYVVLVGVIVIMRWYLGSQYRKRNAITAVGV